MVVQMCRYPLDLTDYGYGLTADGRLFPTRLPEPEWLQRRYAHAQALRELEAEQRAAIERGSAPRPGLAARMLQALGLA